MQGSRFYPERISKVEAQCASCGNWYTLDCLDGPYGDKPYTKQYYCKNAQLCIQRREGRGKMTNALWCDPGEHAFPEGQAGSTTLGVREMVRNQWGGAQEHIESQTVCAAHAVQLGLNDVQNHFDENAEAEKAVRIASGKTGGFLGRKTKAIEANKDAKEARAKDYDPAYTKALEYMADNPDWEPPWETK